MVELQPETGPEAPTIHMAHIGHPIVGDKIYGGDEMRYLRFVSRTMTAADLAALIVTNHALHARACRFSGVDAPGASKPILRGDAELVMKIEHTAYQVADPPAVARWYVEHLGLTIKRSQDASPLVTSCRPGRYGDVGVLPPASPPRAGLLLGQFADSALAFWADDVPGTRARPLAAGATSVGEVVTTGEGDEVAMLRDPWGLPAAAGAARKGYAGLMSKLNDPVLPGTAASDYERYLRTDELLALQKPAGEMLPRRTAVSDDPSDGRALAEAGRHGNRNSNVVNRRRTTRGPRCACCDVPISVWTWWRPAR